MSEQQSQPGLGRDVLGLALMVIAVFSGVSVGMALGSPPAHAGGTTAVFIGMVELLGPVSSFVLAAGLALVGVLLWLRGISNSVLRHLFGVLVTTVTSAVLFGAIAPGLGGVLGNVGEMVTNRLTIFVGVPTGLALVLLPAWFLWLRPAEFAAAREENRTVAPHGAQDSDSGGVTAAEAEALLPRPAVAPARPARPSAAQVLDPAPARQPTVPRTPPTSPYPADVRVHGGIPEGARPLEDPHARRASAGPRLDAALQREPARPAGGGEHQRAGAAVAGVEVAGAGERAADERRLAAERATHAHPARPSALAPQELVAPAAPPAAPAPAEAAPAAVAPSEPYSTTPPAPSWEQPTLFEEEPVDAYGTPLSLVEKLRAQDEPLASTEAAPQPDSPAPAPLEFGDEDLGDEADLSSVRPLTVGEAEQAEVGDEADEPVAPQAAAPSLFDAEPAVAAAEREDEDDEPLDDEDSEVDDELEDQDEDEADDEAEEDDDELDGDDEFGSEPDDDELAAERKPLEPELPFAAPAASASAPAEAPAAPAEPELAAPAAASAEQAEVEADEADELDEPPAAEEPEDEPRRVVVEFDAEPQPAVDEGPLVAAPEDDPAEPEVVLQPVAGAGAKSRPAALVTATSYKAGCLFLERQRVAVSMLQREYGMDFKTATAVLDELQKVGLIGPYLGGQRRDILMSAEEFKEKVGIA